MLPEAFCLVAGVLKQSIAMVQGPEVDPRAMMRNVEMTGGFVMSEAVMMGPSRYMGRAALQRTLDPVSYLGQSGVMVDRVLALMGADEQGSAARARAVSAANRS